MLFIAEINSEHFLEKLFEFLQLIYGSWVLSAIAMLLLIPAAVMYIGGPIAVFFTLRLNQKPTVDLVLPKKHYARLKEAREYFEDYDLELEDHDFEMVSEFFLPDAVETAKMFGQLWFHEPSKTYAILNLSYMIQQGELNCQSKQMSFCSTYHNGKIIETSNTKDFGMLPADYNRNMRSMFWESDIEVVWKAHQLFSTDYNNHSSPIDKLNKNFQGDVSAFLIAGMIYEYEVPIEKGYLTTGTNNMYRPTIKGAIIMTYKLLPPFKQIRFFLMKRRVQNKLNQLGVVID